MKIGAVTIGQSPRVDVTKDIMGIFGSSVELIQAGGLDGLTKEEIKAFAPEKDDYVLVSRLTDGSSVTFARTLYPAAPSGGYKENGGRGLCSCNDVLYRKLSGEPFHRKIPLIYPCDILDRVVPLLTKSSHIICLTPSPLQEEQCAAKWKNYVQKVSVVAASPYGDWGELEKAAEEISGMEEILLCWTALDILRK